MVKQQRGIMNYGIYATVINGSPMSLNLQFRNKKLDVEF